MRRAGYQLLGYVVWKLTVRGLRRQSGGPGTKLVAGALVAAVLVAVVLAARRGGGGDDDV